ncbi:MAG: class I SAM-dependent methyltransferase [Planctomycetes bacterium]|nr:class I SAM-dependent methyltransferase [Planctomycetota bacterium]MCB9908849.1 class I SAM-dependent methyltransferase [Planctomycetota bacterium]HPF13370.1 class I SAM-dependent methyltransferase [Planctomycetota bacterium]
MDAPTRKPSPLEAKWDAPHSGAHYQSDRFANARRRDRDLRLIAKLWKRFGPEAQPRWLLDMPCGTGRLQPLLTELSHSVVSIDVAGAMLGAHAGSHRIRARALEAPLAPGSMDAVVCCRLFHHLRDDSLQGRLLAELLRVSRGPVFLSFWDAGSYHAWRRRVGLRKVRNQDGRLAIRRRDLERAIEAAGGRLLGYAHSWRGISQQAFVAFESASR